MNAPQKYDIVRSFDFAYDRTSYLEGVFLGDLPAGDAFEFQHNGETLSAVFGDCARCIIRVTKQVVDGETFPKEHTPSFVFPPVNGTRKLFGGVCDGVETVEKA